MMNRLRSTTQTLGAAAAFICALSLAAAAAPSPLYAAASTVSGTDDASQQPCNDVCRAYMAWSDRVSAQLRPSSPVAQTAVPDGKPAGQMVHRRASRTRQPSLNSFAQFPVRRSATAQSAETAQAVVGPSRPLDGIADRFPTTAGFVTALLAGPAGATNEAPDSTVVPVADAIPATQGTSTTDATAGGVDMQFLVSLFLALCILSALVFWGWGRTRRAIR
jgi:hypothetical protein